MKIQTFKKKNQIKELNKTNTTLTTKVTKPLNIQCEKIPLSIQQYFSKELKPKSTFEI